MISADQTMERFLKDRCLRIGATEQTALQTADGKKRPFTSWGFTECIEYLDQQNSLDRDRRVEFLRFHSFRNPVQHVGLEPSERQVEEIISSYQDFVKVELESDKQTGLDSPTLSKFYLSIKELDRSAEVVSFDLQNKRLTYSNKIVQHRKISNLTDEEIVRAYLVVKLVKTFGYHLETIELEKFHKIGRKGKQTEARIDILVKKDINTFMIIEVKRWEDYNAQLDSSIQTQLFPLALLEDPNGNSVRYMIYYSATSTEAGIVEKFETIDFKKFRTYDDWVKDGRPNPRLIPHDYAIVRKATYVKGNTNDLRTNVTRKELDSIRQNLHDILYGGGKYQTELFFNLLSIILAKIYDEKTTDVSEPYKFQIIYKNGDIQSAKEVYDTVDELYRNALKEFLGYTQDEAEKVHGIVFDAPKVKYVVDLLQPISLTQNLYDILGEFFEQIVWNEFKQSKGQYFTHRNIVKFILYALQIDELSLKLVNEQNRLPFIIDPACGSGTFLIESMKLITSYINNNTERIKKSENTKAFIASKFPTFKQNAWADEFIYGIEINKDLSVATKVNMVMHGDGAANIEAADALISFGMYAKDKLKKYTTSEIYPFPVLNSFDIVVSNPPFSITIEKDTAESLPNNFVWGKRILERFEKQKKKKEVNVETLFLERWYQLLRPNGRLGVVLPETVFDTGENRYVRLFLYKYFKIKAIVSLPDETFEPFTSTKTSLLFAQKKTYDEVVEYQTEWNRLEKEYDELERDIKAIFEIKTPQMKVDQARLSENSATIANKLKKYIHERYDSDDSGLPAPKLIEKYIDEVKLVDKEWWVFTEIAKRLNYNICMANVEKIGYKRTLRGEIPQPNELFADINSPKGAQTVLNFLKQRVKWD